METSLNKPRVEVVDALRGLVIMAILLLHNLEHFDLYFFPEWLPDWLKTLDGAVWSTLFFVFAGKSYAIFALLFGFTFHIQSSNQAKKGKDFRGRFAWRLLLLLGFGAVNSIFFQGDILAIYAVIGLVLIPVARLKDSWVFVIAVILLLQPQSWGHYIYALQHPAYELGPNACDKYFGLAAENLSNGSFLDVVKSNFTVGKMAVVSWSWVVGRVYQTAGLFMLGMLIGRRSLFVYSESSIKFWKYALGISIAAFCLLFFTKPLVIDSLSRPSLKGILEPILTSYSNFLFMVVLASAFICGYYLLNAFQRMAKGLSSIGRMTLTNYVLQSILGTFIYYGFGLSLYKYTGATMSLCIAIALIALQMLFCRWWLKSHKQGPLEALWHKATWINFR